MSTVELELPAPPARQRRVLPLVLVCLVLAVVVFGGYVTVGALSTPEGPPVLVAGRMHVTPLSGWRATVSGTGARLTRGSATLDVAAGAFDGGDEELLRAYVDGFLRDQASQLSVSHFEAVRLASGRTGSRVSYVGTFDGIQGPIEGEVTAVVADSGLGVVFDGWSPNGLLRYALGDIHTMIERARVVG